MRHPRSPLHRPRGPRRPGTSRLDTSGPSRLSPSGKPSRPTARPTRARATGPASEAEEKVPAEAAAPTPAPPVPPKAPVPEVAAPPESSGEAPEFARALEAATPAGWTLDYVERQEDLAPALRRFAGVRRIAVDTESNSLHAYRERVCFVQLAAAGHIVLVDTVRVTDLSPIEDLVSGPETLALLHGADYDVVCMKRDFGFGPAPLFDTMIASQLLGHEQLGLAALLERHLGIVVDKAFTKHDWGARPLDPQALPYLVEDVIHLEALHDALAAEIEEKGLEEEAAIEFERVALLEWTGSAEVDPDGFFRLKGARDLVPKELRVLRELYFLREEVAAERDVPAFKALRTQAMIELARRRPTTTARLKGIPGLDGRTARKLGDRIVEAVKDGGRRRDTPERPRRRRRDTPGVDPVLEDALKAWRKRRVAETGFTPLVVLPNHVLQAICRARPKTRAGLLRVPGMRTTRRKAEADAILSTIAAARS